MISSSVWFGLILVFFKMEPNQTNRFGLVDQFTFFSNIIFICVFSTIMFFGVFYFMLLFVSNNTFHIIYLMLYFSKNLQVVLNPNETLNTKVDTSHEKIRNEFESLTNKTQQ